MCRVRCKKGRTITVILDTNRREVSYLKNTVLIDSAELGDNIARKSELEELQFRVVGRWKTHEGRLITMVMVENNNLRGNRRGFRRTHFRETAETASGN